MALRDHRHRGENPSAKKWVSRRQDHDGYNDEESDDYSLESSGLDEDPSGSHRAEDWENQDFHPTEILSQDQNDDFESEDKWEEDQNYRQRWNTDFNARKINSTDLIHRRRNR